MTQKPCAPTCSCRNGSFDGTPLARREFLKQSALAGALSTLTTRMGYADIEALYAAGRKNDIEALEQALQAWAQELWADTGVQRYTGEHLRHIAFPIGGIGAGQLYITGQGRLVSWQIQNNFRHDLDDSAAFFALRTRDAYEKIECRLLHYDERNPEALGPIEAVCEYPFCMLRYQDNELPVEVTLKAWSPFEPLNSGDSALPVALFTFTLKNTTHSTVHVSLLAALQNRIGWDGYTPLQDQGLSGLEYMGNYNRFIQDSMTSRISMATQKGDMARLGKAGLLITRDSTVAQLMRLCENLEITQKFQDISLLAEQNIFFVSGSHLYPSEEDFLFLLEVVSRGGALILADGGEGILGILEDEKDSTTQDEVFDDFESGTYDNWRIEGNCFGPCPAKGTLANQNPVTGFRGNFLLNTYFNGDGSTGRAISKPFIIHKKYIHFLIGGGNHPGRACINLIVNGTVVRTATGVDDEQLRPTFWDVSEFRGQEATLEIVDNVEGRWGHINIDHIVFSNSAIPPGFSTELREACKKAFPFSFSSAVKKTTPETVRPSASWPVDLSFNIVETVQECLYYENMKLKPETVIAAESQSGNPIIVMGRYGKGKVIVYNGHVGASIPGPILRDLCGILIALALDCTHQKQTGWSSKSLPYGTMELFLLDPDKSTVSALPEWDDWRGHWNLFVEKGNFSGVRANQETSPAGRTWNGSLVTQLQLSANEEKTVTLGIAWHFPNRMRDQRYFWGIEPYNYKYRLGNMYNKWFSDAAQVVNYIARHFNRLEKITHAFHETFYNTTLPRRLLDAVTANIANLRSPLYLWLEDGTVAAFEGTDCCCPMNCTHVFNYVMTVAFLFPELERNVRETDLLVQMHPEQNYIPHRTVLPLTAPRVGFQIGGPEHPALDGELGTILKTSREWKQSGDTAWLRKVWPAVKKHMEYIIRTHDPEETGVIRGEQPNTYDIHTYGSNTFIGSLYLAALLATEAMATAMGDPEFATKCRSLFEKGRIGYDRVCWNGEYYINVYDAPGVSENDYNKSNCWGPGCHADQLLGQWWANVLGLGYVLPREHVAMALDSMYKYCWRGRLDLPEHNQRVFAEPWERGLVNCAWPHGGRPKHPIQYCDEVWTGIEYEVAALLFHEGKLEQAMHVVAAARDRYTGKQRNPFSEIECGGHYARALSSYTLLTSVSGIVYDAVEEILQFCPRVASRPYGAFFVGAKGWGLLSLGNEKEKITATVALTRGTLHLKKFILPVKSMVKEIECNYANIDIKAVQHDEQVTLILGHGIKITESRPFSVYLG